jgi:hypothetical protein
MNTKYIFTAFASLALTACNLDYNPTTAVSDATLTPSDYENLLTGVYDGAQSIKLPINDIAADNLTSPGWWPDIDNNGQTASTSSDINSLWNSHYKYVQLANNLINLIDKQSAPSAQQIQIAAQAHVIRGWLYSHIAQHWGDAPLLLEVSDALAPRNPEAEIWKQVVADFEYGVEYAPEFSDRGYVSKVAAKALLARTLLTGAAEIQDAARAKQLAEEIISSNQFALADNFADIFHAKTSNEIILQWTNLNGDSGSDGWFMRSDIVNLYESENGAGSAGYGEQGRYENRVDKTAFGIFDDADKRKAATVRHLKLANGVETWDCVKFPSYNAADPTPVIRIAELYLISAEAQGYPAGIDRLNQLRQKRGLTPLVVGTDITADNFLEKIMHERRLEFFGEGLRWYDLRRWFHSGEAGKKAVLALRKYQPGEAAGSRPQASETMNIADDGHNLLWPVPQTAIDNDPNLLPQNPGY